MTNNTTTAVLSAADAAYYAAAESHAVNTRNVPAHVARAVFLELPTIPATDSFYAKVLTAANRAVDATGSAIHPKGLADSIVAAFRDAA